MVDDSFFFKIGEIVTVRDDLQLSTEYKMHKGRYSDVFVREMQTFRGKPVRIDRYSSSKYKIGGSGHFWTDEMFVEYIQATRQPADDSWVIDAVPSFSDLW